LAVAGHDGCVSVYDLAESRSPHVFQRIHTGPVEGLSFSPFNRYLLASAGRDQKIVLYDVERKT
jgi:WD40 repeat protein